MLDIVISDNEKGGFFVDVTDVKKSKLEMVFRVSGDHAAALDLARTIYNSADNITGFSDCTYQSLGVYSLSAQKVRSGIEKNRREGDR